MRYRMPEAVCVRDAPWRLSLRRNGLHYARAAAWRVLRWLLLGADGAVIRGRRDEPALDRSPRVTGALGAEHFQRSLARPPCRRRSHRGQCVDFLSGNVLTVAHGAVVPPFF